MSNPGLKPTFPIFSTVSSSQTTPDEHTLFPAYASETKGQNTHEKTEQQDWLNLTSYQPHTAQVLQKIQDTTTVLHKIQEIAQAVTNERLDDSSASDDGSGKNTHKECSPAQSTESRPKSHGKRTIETDESDDEKHYKRHKKKKTKHKHKHKHKSHKHKKESSSGREKEHQEKDSISELQAVSKSKVFIEDMSGLELKHAFRIDRQPDYNNLSYESLYKMHIAKSRRVGYTCLGLRPGQVVLFSDSKRKHVKNSSRYFDKENISSLYNETDVLDLSRREDKEVKKLNSGMFLTPFITIEKELEQPSAANPLGIYDAATACYIQGKPSEKQTRELGSNAPHTSLKETFEEKLKRQREQYNKNLRDNPHNVELWLEFIKFQDESLNHRKIAVAKESAADRDMRKREDSLLLEKKLAVFDRALEINPGSIELKTAQLDLCQGVWDVEKLNKEWKHMLFVHANVPSLWEKYLTYMCSAVTQFSVNKTVAAYGKAISTLHGILKGDLLSHDPLPDTEYQLLDIFIQHCQFLKQSGHTEKAVASFQAVIEFNLFCPDILQSSSFKERVEHFETFWDSSTPRVGENGAIGWKNWVLDKERASQMPAMKLSGEEEGVLEDGIISNHKDDRPQAWIAMEMSRNSRHWLPWKPDMAEGETEEDCEDPDRLVLSDDVTPCLMILTNEQHKLYLVKAFLQFLDVTVTVNEVVSGDVFKPGTTCQFDSRLKEKVLHNMFSQTTRIFNQQYNTELSVLWLRYEQEKFKMKDHLNDKAKKAHAKEVRKFAKSLLKEDNNRNNLQLWNEYATLEWETGKVGDARNVFDTAIGMYAQDALRTNNSDSESEACLLYYTYATLECGIIDTDYFVDSSVGAIKNKGEDMSEHYSRALHILNNMVSGCRYASPLSSPVPPTQLLKGRKSFQQKLETLLSKPTSDSSCQSLLLHWTNCCALFEYLTLDFTAASLIYKGTLTHLENCSNEDSVPTQKALFTSYLRLACYQVTNHIAPLPTVRNPLKKALAKFPDCSRFLKLFVDIELLSHASGTLRQYFTYANLSSSMSVVPWMFAINAELSRFQKLKMVSAAADSSKLPAWMVTAPVDIGITHRTRALFEHSVESQSGKRCIELWRMFIKFEIEHGSADNALAVFYRGLQKCPWSKELYMDGVKYFPAKIQEILDLMTEKEIRLRAPLEEVDLLLENAGENDVSEVTSDGS